MGKEHQKDTKKHKQEESNSVKKDLTIVSELLKDVPIPEDVKKSIIEGENIPTKQKLAIAHKLSISYSSHYPPPQVLKEYQNIDHSLVESFKNWAHAEQKHRHDMDNADIENDKGELSLKRRGQTIAAWMVPLVLVLAGVAAYLIAPRENSLEVFKTYLWFVFGIGALFLTGRVISGIENIFTSRRE